MFLQAAGTRSTEIYRYCERDDASRLTQRQQTLIGFAEKLTMRPRAFSTTDTAALLDVLADDGEVVEATNVVAGFNFANRVADTLAVPLEVPESLGRFRPVRQALMWLMSVGIRMRMNLAPRVLQIPDPVETLFRLEQAVTRERMGELPSYFGRLRCRPHILAGHAAICTSLLNDPGFSRATVLRISYLVSCLNGDLESADNFADLLRQAGESLEPMDAIAAGQEPAPPGGPDEAVLLFARDVTLCAYAVTDSQVVSLRERGLSDVHLLNLVLIIAALNSANRMNRALA